MFKFSECVDCGQQWDSAELEELGYEKQCPVCEGKLVQVEDED